MPLSAFAELILQPVIEIVIQVAGYVTAWIVIPLCTLGWLRVESIPFREFVKPGKGHIKRQPNGAYLIEAELASLFGLVIWFLVIATYAFSQHT